MEDKAPPNHIKKVNQYALLEVLGNAATSKVYLAYDTQTDKPFAAKAISVHGSNNEALTLEREIRLLRRLDHPNIIQLHEVLHNRNQRMVYVILDWASAGSLQDRIHQRLPLNAIASIFKQVVNGLAYLHDQGIVHQDIKPSNILLFDNGIAKLSDFGICHSFDSTEQVMGSPAYQAPEVFDDSCDTELDCVKEDVWSLGVSLFETISGRLPYSEETVCDLWRGSGNRPLVIPDGIPRSLRDLIANMLQVDPDKRFDLEQVRAHPFLAEAEETFRLGVSPRDVPRLTASRSMYNVAADVCGEGYSFASRQRALSWPGAEPEAVSSQ
jgi:serine/threonine-protein kinase 11